MRTHYPRKLKRPFITFSPSFMIGLFSRKSPIPNNPELGLSVLVVVEAEVVVILAVELFVDSVTCFPKNNARVVLLVVVVVDAGVVLVEKMAVGILKSLVFEVVKGLEKSRVVAKSSVRLPS